MPKKNEIAAVPQGKLVVASCDSQPKTIENMILNIRGKQVMLDRDLAMLYGVETKRLNEQVKRNIERFPEDFMFQLNKEECSRLQIATAKSSINQPNTNLKSQIATSSWGGTRKRPYAFTENGVAMLSGVLRSPKAIETNILIMRAFTAMRHFIGTHAQMFQRLEIMERNQLAITAHLSDTDKKLDEVFRRLDDGSIRPTQGIFFDGQVFDAYSFASDLIREAKKRIILIDNYVDDTVLTLLDKRKKNVSATIYTLTITSQLKLDFQKHNEQYAPIDVLKFTRSHDRFLCIDDAVYHLGASLKDLGKKWFAFSRMEITTDELLTNIK